jgi:hypothetical protein
MYCRSPYALPLLKYVKIRLCVNFTELAQMVLNLLQIHFETTRQDTISHDFDIEVQLAKFILSPNM